MMRFVMMLGIGAALAAPGVALAQQEEVLTTEPAASPTGTSWRSLSRTSGSIYLVDVGGMSDADGARIVRMARAPRTPQSRGDREHVIETYQFRCDANQWRVVRTEEYGPDGAELDAWDEADAAWLDIPPQTNMDFLKSVACDGELPAGRPWSTIEGFLASDRT
jgi:hypothetical protein